jgi:hypothetical protein
MCAVICKAFCLREFSIQRFYCTQDSRMDPQQILRDYGTQFLLIIVDFRLLTFKEKLGAWVVMSQMKILKC